MSRDEAQRLVDMLEAAREAIAFAAGKTRADLDTDRKLALALTKLLEIIGEAAATVPISSRNVQPGIEWRQIIRMRNRLIHSYFSVDLDIVWETVTNDLQPLVTFLEKLVAT